MESMTQEKSAVLRGIGLFQELTAEELGHIEALAVERNYPRGSYVFMEGQTREAVYFVRRGLIKVFKVDGEGREHIVNILGSGQMFPHVGFFDDSPYPGTAEALENSVLLSIRSSAFESLLTDYPDIARKVMRVMGKRILQLQSKLQEIALFDAHDRVVALLRHLADEHGIKRTDGIHVKLPVTHSEMARMIGMTRESVNRVWNQLRRDGVLEGDKDEWVFHFDRFQQG